MHGFFHASLFVGFAGSARLDGKAVVPGKIQVTRMRHRRLAHRVGEDGGFTVICDHFSGNPVKVFKGVLVAGQEVFLRLSQGELDVKLAAVAEHHDKERKPAPGVAHWQNAGVTPIDLRRLTRRKVQGQERRRWGWAHMLHESFEDAVATLIAGLPQTVEQLGGGIRMLGQEPHDSAFERVELALALARLARLIGFNSDPFADRAFIQGQGRGDLCRREVFFIAQMPDLMEGLVVDHAAPPSTTARKMSPTLRA